MSDLNAPPCALPDSPLAQAAAGLDACVHCGFCLPACPTYVTLHDENDSPRGRLLLMRRLLDGDLAPDDPDVGTHLDRCLGCRGCETACPSGVPYGALLEATRATLRDHRPTPWIARVVLGVFARPGLLAAALLGARLLRATGLARRLAGVLPARAAFPMAMLASTAPVRWRTLPRADATRPSADSQRSTGAPATRSLATASSRASSQTRPDTRVTTLTGCVMQGLFAHVHEATHIALCGTGHTVVPTAGQRCCGALHAHAGDLDTARALARHNVAAFERVPDAVIAVNSAGCGAMLKEYGHLLHDDPAWATRAAAVSARVRDISELLAERLDTVASRSPERTLRVAYDPPCHLMHAQRVTAQPLDVLRALPQVELVPLEDADLCCGSAGIYNLVEPDTSDAVLSPKLQHILDARVDVVATGNPGCLMQLGAALLQAGSETRAVHPVELVAQAMSHGGD
ncbi:MAG TPA: heterodisulfide reductase-related iron-sulfur binding cluster [Gemmatimonadaceae bacterium]|nr:heterodisulfide reductase-related iron-sulfur binding cluster [Gemmatimonadaceae bacterium]